MTTEVRRLHRSSRHKIMAGVCGGFAEYFEIDTTIVRILAVILLCISGGTFMFGYILAWIVMPLDLNLPPQANAGTAQPTGAIAKSNRPSFWSTYFPGVVLIIVGGALLMRQMWYWVDMRLVWPAILVVIGLLIIAFSFGSDRINGRREQKTGEGAIS